jgi:hypothetical protein
LTLSVNSLLGGSGTTGTVTLSGPAPAGGAVVTLISGNAAIGIPSTVTVPQGQTTANFNVTTSPVAVILASTIQALFGPCGGVTVNLTVNAPILNALGISPNSVKLLGNATGTVSLNGPAPTGGITVSLGSNSILGTLLLNMPASVVIPAGQTSATFNIHPTLSLGLLLSAVNATITASTGGISLNSILSVLPLL